MKRHLISLLTLLALSACSEDPGWVVPTVSMSDFRHDVYPVLIRDCAFQTCHGAPERFFRVWGTGRTRLDPMTQESTPTTEDEIAESYQRAISLIDATDPRRSTLLRKPLATEAGGMGHLGADKFGRNVYRSVDSEGYVKLSLWVFSVMRQ
jgi:hypothetical protein